MGWHNHSLKVSDGNNKYYNSTKFYCNGISNIYEIITDQGIKIKGTFNHKIKVFTEKGFIWKEIQDLQEKDYIVSKLNTHKGKIQNLKHIDLSERHFNENNITFPKVIDEDFAFFLGYFMGNGYVASGKKDYRVGVTYPNKSYLVDEMPLLIKKLFKNITFYIQNGEGECKTLHISNKQLKEFLILNKISKTTSSDAKIPLLIRKSPINIVGMYLRGLFESDGTLCHGYPLLTTTSSILANETAVLLYSIGCPCKIKIEKYDSNSYINRLGNLPIYTIKLFSNPL